MCFMETRDALGWTPGVGAAGAQGRGEDEAGPRNIWVLLA